MAIQANKETNAVTTDKTAKANSKAHDQLGLTTQAERDDFDKKVAATLAALEQSKNAPTRTDIVATKTKTASDTFTIDVNECIRFKDDGNYGIVTPQHSQLCRTHKRARIKPRDLVLAIEEDDEMRDFFTGKG